MYAHPDKPAAYQTPTPAARPEMGFRDLARRDATRAPATLDQPVDAADVPPARSVWRTALRIVRDAAIGLALVASIPLYYVHTKGPQLPKIVSHTNERVTEVARYRVLATPIDPSIAPLTAGEAMRRLQDMKESADFPARPATVHEDRPWRTITLTDGMFAALRAGRYPGPDPARIVAAAPAGFSPEEMAYLRAVAEAPLWRDVDLVAHAEQVDLLGGLYQRPFRETAIFFSMPILRFAATKELAYASTARAAYYLAAGDRARAESALRTVVSFGFALIDDGSTTIDALIGRVMVDIGRDGLEQLYRATGNTQGLQLAARLPETKTAPQGRVATSSPRAVSEEALIAGAADATLPRPLRFERLAALSLTSCSSLRGVLLGPSPAVQQAFRSARTDLARFPSEREYVDLMARGLATPVDASTVMAPDHVLLGAATVAGVVLNNPRIVGCTRLLQGIQTR